jgi:16S rRNA (cytosine1402-N4)-methyltransferase
MEGILEKDFYGKIICPLKSITRKPITPGATELTSNPRSRSAKLRIAQKI